MAISDLLDAVLRYQGIEYAVCDSQRRIREHSRSLPGLVTTDPVPASLVGWRLEELFVEFMGAEASLTEDVVGGEPCFHLKHVYRESLGGRPGYLTLTVVGYGAGLLVIVADTTQESDLARGLMQQRNEVLLLQAKLQAANDRLDYLLHHLVPTSVARQVMAQRELPKLGGQCRTVTLLFADVRGYTTLAETLDPAVVMDMLNRQFSVIGGLIAQYGGTINQYAGDQIMAIFNAPDEQPDHALRAVTAGLDIQAALANLEDRFFEGAQRDMLRFGIGVNTGPVVVGYLGFEARFDYTAIGDATNVAARLSSVARPREVLIGPRTQELVREHIQTEPVEPIQLRGRATHIAIYRALR